MDENGIHCGIADLQRDVPLYIFSPLVENGRFEDHYIGQRNIAPMLCRLLGLKASDAMISPDEIRFK